MKTVLLFLASFALAQQDTILTVDDQVDKFATDFSKAINEEQKNEYLKKKAEFDAEMQRIEDEVQGVIDGYRVIQFSSFKIQSTDNCDALPVVPEPPKSPEEIECVSAKYDANLMSKTILSLTKSTPLDFESIQNHLVECELLGNGKIGVKLNIYHKCLEANFAHIYQEHFEALKVKMTQEGFTYNEVTKEFEKTFELEGTKIETEVPAQQKV